MESISRNLGVLIVWVTKVTVWKTNGNGWVGWGAYDAFSPFCLFPLRWGSRFALTLLSMRCVLRKGLLGKRRALVGTLFQKKTEEPNKRFRTKFVREDVCFNIYRFSGSRPKSHFNENKFWHFSVSLLFLNQFVSGGNVFTFMFLAVSAVQFFSSEGRFACLSAAHGRW